MSKETYKVVSPAFHHWVTAVRRMQVSIEATIEWCVREIVTLPLTQELAIPSSRAINGNNAWVREIANDTEYYVKAMYDGYRVQDSQSYAVPVPYVEQKGIFYCLNEEGEVSFRQGKPYPFTKAEVSNYFPELLLKAIVIDRQYTNYIAGKECNTVAQKGE